MTRSATAIRPSGSRYGLPGVASFARQRTSISANSRGGAEPNTAAATTSARSPAKSSQPASGNSVTGARFTPMPTSGGRPGFSSHRIPPTFLPSANRSFGQAIRQSRASATAIPAARAMPGGHSAAVALRQTTVRARHCGAETHCLPRRPRPLVCLSAAMASKLSSPDWIRRLASSCVESTSANRRMVNETPGA